MSDEFNRRGISWLANAIARSGFVVGLTWGILAAACSSTNSSEDARQPQQVDLNPAAKLDQRRAADGPSARDQLSVDQTMRWDKVMNEPDLPRSDRSGFDHPVTADLESGFCAAGKKQVFVYGSGLMIICQGGLSNQCGAGSFCSSGWHLCTASEFLSRGGATTSTKHMAWIAGCIRSGGAPHAPTDFVCPSCTTSTTTSELVAWGCQGNPSGGVYVSQAQIGVVTSSDCYAIGVNGTATAGYWGEAIAASQYSDAACCY